MLGTMLSSTTRTNFFLLVVMGLLALSTAQRIDSDHDDRDIVKRLSFASAEAANPYFDREKRIAQLFAQGYTMRVPGKQRHFRDKVIFDGVDASTGTQRTVVLDNQEPVRALSLHEWAELRPTQQPHIKHRRRNMAHIKDKRQSPTPDDYWAILPVYVDAVPINGSISWSTTCYPQMEALFTQMGNSTATLTIKSAGGGDHPFDPCTDFYLFATPSSWHLQEVAKDTTIEIQWEGMSEQEWQDIAINGIRVFRFDADASETVVCVFETVQFMVAGMVGNDTLPQFNVDDTLKFLVDYANYTLPPRPEATQDIGFEIDESTIHSGDFMAILRLDGLGSMLAWAMGSHTSHTAIAMWIEGELHVCESTANTNYWSTNFIQKTPWKEWLRKAKAADYLVQHLPLSSEARAKFNATAAIAWFNSTAEGLNYGYHNMIWGWIDTKNDNFPANMNSEVAMVGFGLMAPYLEFTKFDLWRQSFNFRLNTTNLTTVELYQTMRERDLNFTDVTTMVEKDEWVYDDGPAMVCDVFVCRMWKNGGLFGNITDEINCVEFGNWDAYSLNFFNSSYTPPEICQQADPGLPVCQLLGAYQMSLPGWNTYEPYPHMREHCPGLPPTYSDRAAVQFTC